MISDVRRREAICRQFQRQGSRKAERMSSVPFSWVVLASTLGDAVLAGLGLVLVLRRSRAVKRARLTLWQLFRATTYTSLVIAAKLVLLRALGIADFGVIHLILL